MTTFLDCEIAEIEAVRLAVGEADVNLWFDNSKIKARFKKACMQDQGLRCCYCQRFKPTIYNQEWDLEHVLCEQHYPQFFATCGNLAVACKSCNGAKLQEDVLLPQPRPDPRIEELPTDSACYSIPHPRLDKWHDHLSHVNYQIYGSKSGKGTKLINVCKLNRPAIEEAGLTHESVVAAVKARFFEIVGGTLDPMLADEAILARMAASDQKGEDDRGNTLIPGLKRVLQKLAKSARKRAPEDAVSKARELAAKRAASEAARAQAPRRKGSKPPV